MTTAEFIKELQEADPSGEAHVRMSGGVPTRFELKEGYWDGPYNYINKEGKWVHSSKDLKVDIYCTDELEFIDENVIEAWNPYKESAEGLWDKAKDQFVMDIGNYADSKQREERADRFFNTFKKDFEEMVRFRKQHWNEHLEMVAKLHNDGCQFFQKKDAKWKYYDGWQFINKINSSIVGQPNLMHTYPILESGKFIPIETSMFPNNEYVEYILKSYSMGLERCPSCNRLSVVTTPHGKTMKERFGTMVHTANSYSQDCLNKECGYTTGMYNINTDVGNNLLKPWYKRLLK